MEAEHNTTNKAVEKANPKDDKLLSKDQKKKDDKKDEDLSEADLALKQQFELYVERVQDVDPALQKVALESMRQEIRTSTSSMTSVPKPLKFLRPHYATLKSCYESMPESDLKKLFADILSILALTMSAEGEPESLKYRMLGSRGDIGSWGHEYVRNLAGEIAQDYAKKLSEESKVDDLIELVEQIVAFHMKIKGANMVDALKLSLQLPIYPMKANISMTELFYLLLRHENNANKKNMYVPKKFSKVNYRLSHPPHNRRRHDKSYSLLM